MLAPVLHWYVVEESGNPHWEWDEVNVRRTGGTCCAEGMGCIGEDGGEYSCCPLAQTNSDDNLCCGSNQLACKRTAEDSCECVGAGGGFVEPATSCSELTWTHFFDETDTPHPYLNC